MKEYNNQLTKLGYTIRKWREFRDIKQQELAYKISKDKSWLSQVENGRTDITYTQVVSIADALNINPSLLLEDFQSKMYDSAFEQKQVASTQNLNDLTLLVKDILCSIKEYKP